MLLNVVISRLGVNGVDITFPRIGLLNLQPYYTH